MHRADLLRQASRLALALVLAGLAVLLAWPGLPAPRARSWDDLLAPFGVGRAAGGYEIAALRRGEEHDLVLTLRKPSGDGGAIEVHVLDRGRWPGIRETASFGVAYETPRSSASVEDCEEVTERIASAIRANDAGGLGPVDAIPLGAEPEPPALARALDRVAGGRGLAIGLCLAAATWLFASGPFGGILAAAWLFALGLSLRAPHLGLPFVRDQDVQRLFTGHLPAGDILAGQGLTDRHPPLYFLVLHAAQLFGRGESVVRLPAALAGALLGPALVWASWALRRRADVGAMAGLAAVLSVEMVSRSREVSSIPLFGLFALAAAVSLARHQEAPSRGSAILVAASHGLMLWTHHVAVLVLAGHLLALLVARRLSRQALRAVGLGVGLGAPALVLAVVTFFRDRGARAAAEAHPGLAWGAQGLREISARLGALSTGVFGPTLAALFVLAAAWALLRREAAVLLPAAAFVSTFCGIAVLAPVARVQPYYLVAVMPLFLLALAVAGSDAWARRREPWIGAAALGAVVAATLAPHVHEARGQYLPDPDAFMPELAAHIAPRAERQVVTIAHYDGTLLAYYLARRAGAPMDWSRMSPDGDGGFRLHGVDRVLRPLVYSHAPGDDPEPVAEASLRRIMDAEPVLVVSREGFHLEGVRRLLRRCDLLAQAGTGKLFRCPAERRR